MTKSTKYIRNQHRFLVFPDSCQHRNMAIQALGPDKLIHGAGFMRLKLIDGKIEAECYGHSESLNRKPRRDDKDEILKGIGVENEGEVEHAKYVSWRGKVIVFCNELEHKTVAQAAFFGKTDCESAGFVKFIPRDDGTIKVQCYGESTSLGVSASADDNIAVAKLMELPEAILFKPSTMKLG